jgi:hypothetical protein
VLAVFDRRYVDTAFCGAVCYRYGFWFHSEAGALGVAPPGDPSLIDP